MGIFGGSSMVNYDAILKDNVDTYLRIASEATNNAYFGSGRVFYEALIPGFIQYFLGGYRYRAGFTYLYLQNRNFVFAHVAVLADLTAEGSYEDPHLLVYDTKHTSENKCMYWHYDYPLPSDYAEDAEVSMDLIPAKAGDRGRWFSDAALWGVIRPFVQRKLLFCNTTQQYISAVDSLLGESSSDLDLVVSEIRGVLERYWPSE